MQNFVRVGLSTAASTYYRRELPLHLTALTSPSGKQMFRNALESGHAELFFSLAGNFAMQSEPEYCGLGSLTSVLNAMAVDPGKRWKGVWRWYSDEMLECAPLDDIKKNGMTFDQVHQVALCNGLTVVSKRGDQTSLDDFISDVKKVSSSSDTHMIVSFSRKSLDQTGDGHFSPIGAYSPLDNQILVLDTARFKYPSYFVDAERLYKSMMPIDKVTGLSRGYLLMSKDDSKVIPLCKIQANHSEIDDLQSLFDGNLVEKLKHPVLASQLVHTIVEFIPDQKHFYTRFYKLDGIDRAGTQESSDSLKKELELEMEHFLRQVEHHRLFSKVTKEFPQLHRTERQLATLFLLSMPRQLFQRFPDWASAMILEWQDFRQVRDVDLLKDEVVRMRSQWSDLLNSHCHDQSCCDSR